MFYFVLRRLPCLKFVLSQKAFLSFAVPLFLTISRTLIRHTAGVRPRSIGSRVSDPLSCSYGLSAGRTGCTAQPRRFDKAWQVSETYDSLYPTVS